MHRRRRIVRAGRVAALTFAAVVALAPALAIMAASASLTVSPQSGLASASFSATYTFSGTRCNNQVLQVRWNSPAGTLLQQVSYPARCGAVTVSGLHPPAGTTPARYSIWGSLVQNGSVVSGTQASVSYSVNPPPPPPSPSPSPKAAGSAAPAPSTAAKTTANPAGSSTAPAAPRSAAVSSGVGGVTTSPAGSPGGTSGNDGQLPPPLLATARWTLRSPIPALGIAVALVAAVIWWVYGTPLPRSLARRQPSPVAEPAAPETAGVDPEPAPAREIYRARPSDLYMPAAPAADLPAPVWSHAAQDTVVSAAQAPATSAAAGEPPRSVGIERGDDGLPRMVPPPPR